MRIIFLGDVVGQSGCNALKKNLKNIIKNQKIDFVIVNGENASDKGVGITEKISNELIRKFFNILKGKVPIIGVGGVDSAESAYNKILSGASLIQLYTGMIYQGPQVVKKIKEELIKKLENDGVKNFKEIIGQGI